MFLSIRVNQINRQTNFSTMDMQKWEVLLFAEDVVSFLMNTKLMWKYSAFSSSKAAPRAGEYRDLVYNGFNEVVKKATYVLYDSLFNFIERQYSRMADTSNVNEECLKSYAKFLWEEQFSDGMDAIRFLRYCAVITGLAGAFYLEGVKRAPDYAAQIIVYHFPRADCLKVTWDVLNKAAGNYLKENNGETYSQIFAALNKDLSLNVDCNCFKTNISGRSFKKIYDMRGKVQNHHFIVCMRADFAKAYEQNLIMRTEDYEADDQTYISSDAAYMDDIYFPEEQSSMSALLKISQAARNCARSSDNHDYTPSGNSGNVIHSNPGNHPNKSGVPKTSQSAEFSEKPSFSGTFLSSTVPKDADSFIFKIPKSVKRFKMSDNENGNKNDQVVPRESVIVRNPIYQANLSLIHKMSEMVKNLR